MLDRDVVAEFLDCEFEDMEMPEDLKKKLSGINYDSSKINTVLKLKKQKWSVEKIARVVNLPEGEVEAIINLYEQR